MQSKNQFLWFRSVVYSLGKKLMETVMGGSLRARIGDNIETFNGLIVAYYSLRVRESYKAT